MIKPDRHTSVEEPSGEWLRRVPVAAGSLVAGVGLLVLVGWLFRMDSFKSVLPGLATMKSNTALCFLLSGLALALRRQHALRLACSGVVCAVASLTLAEYIGWSNLGLDQLLFRDTVDPHTVYPGRMVQATALGFLLSGASLLLLEEGSRGGRRAQQALAVCAGVIGMIAVLGYAYDAQQLYRFAGYSSMALHTAVSFVVLALGLVLAQPDGLARMLSVPGPSSLMMRRLLPMTLLLPVVTGWLVDRGLERGFYGEGMDLALLALAMMFSLAAMVWWTAAALNRAESVRKRDEELVEQAYGRLKTFFDVRIRGIGIVIARADGSILQANDYYLDILGHTRQEFEAGKVKWIERTPPEWLPADERALAQLRELGACDPYEKEYVRRDGTRVPVLITDAMMPGEEQDILAIVVNMIERKQAEEAIKASLQEKEVLLKEIHHRVKNNMQVISSLVSLQTDNSKDEAVREVLKDVAYRVRSMALVHEKLYQSADLAQVDFAEYTKSLLHFLWRSHGAVASSIRLTFDLEPVALPADKAVPCGLILNELAGNALKHAFKGRSEGEVTVSLHNGADGRIRLSVADNGVGLPEGLDWRQAKSLGLHLVQMLSGQIDAEVEIESGEATRFEIVFGGSKVKGFNARSQRREDARKGSI